MRLVKFNLEDFVTNVDWKMTAIFEIDGHWIEGKLYCDDGNFSLALYDIDNDSYEYCSYKIKDITFYMPLD